MAYDDAPRHRLLYRVLACRIQYSKLVHYIMDGRCGGDCSDADEGDDEDEDGDYGDEGGIIKRYSPPSLNTRCVVICNPILD